MLVDYVRIINSLKKMKFKDTFEFISFDDISLEDLAKDEVPDHLEIWAGVRISYEGELPESYKALNLMIGDWVEGHEEELTEVIHEKLKAYIHEKYPDAEADISSDDTSIWLDQLDYMPRSEEDKKHLDIEIELVLEVEAEDE